MHLHSNAKLTPASRRHLVRQVRELGCRVTEAAEAAGVSRQTAYKWLARHDAEGEAGLEDRSCRPHRLRSRTPRRVIQRMLQDPLAMRILEGDFPEGSKISVEAHVSGEALEFR